MTGRGSRLAAGLLLALLLGGCSVLTRQPAPDAAAGVPAAVEQGPRVAAYELRISAPGGLDDLLMQHLDLARFREAPADQRLSPSELARLAASAPEQARALLETEGYFNPQIELQRQRRESDGLYQLALQVDPGPRTLVSRLNLRVDGALQAAAQRGERRAQRLLDGLQNDWPLQPQTGFSQPQWSAAKNALLTRARSQGYPLARLSDSQARVLAADNQVELELVLDSGPLFLLGELQIEGLKNQPELSVRRIAGYDEGDPYREKTLLDFQERLINTQLFDSVAVEIQPEAVSAAAGQETVQVPVRVQLREAARQQVTLSLGYHSANGPSIGVEHIHRRPLGLNLRARTKLNLGRDKSVIDTEISSHPRPDMQRSLAALYLERIKADQQVNTNLRTRLGYARETERQDRLDYLELLHAWERAPGLPQTRASAISLNEQRIWRRLDSKLLPTRGYSASVLLGAGWADSNTESRGPFGRLRVLGTWYRPLPSRWLLSARTEFGQIFAREDLGLPEALRFRTGGDDTVRGYGFEDLGPSDAKGNRTGGRVLWNGSVELAHPLTARVPGLLGAVFVDAGQAAPRWSDLKPAWSYGLGLRYRSPVGVLRMDIAKGNQADRPRLHFSVAIAL